MNAAEVIEYARNQQEHVTNGDLDAAYLAEVVPDLLALAEEQAATLDRVRALHKFRTVQVITGDCAAEECDHEEVDDCPTIAFNQCEECDRIADEANTYYAESGVGITSWPCPTIAALDGQETPHE